MSSRAYVHTRNPYLPQTQLAQNIRAVSDGFKKALLEEKPGLSGCAVALFRSRARNKPARTLLASRVRRPARARLDPSAGDTVLAAALRRVPAGPAAAHL